MKKKTIIILTILGVCLVTGTYYFVSKRNKQPVYYWRTAPAELGDVDVVVTATGNLSADTTVAVGTQVTGIIAKYMADFNDQVKKNQVIARIDTTFLSATKDDADAALEKAITQFDEAKREYDRTKTLYEQKVSAQADYDQALANYETAKSTIKSFRAQLRRAIINLQYATIKAPISGTVISRNVDVGQTVIASFNTPTLFTIANDLTKMQVQANVAEADIGRVAVGEEVVFTVDAFPDTTFTGRVFQVRLNPVIIQNVVNYVVIINVPNPGRKLMPGMTANINIKIISHKDVMKVPSNSLHFTPPEEFLESSKTIPDSLRSYFLNQVLNSAGLPKGVIAQGQAATKGFVWMKRNETVFPVRVSLGITDGTYTEVSGDVKAGDLVVTGLNKEEVQVAPKTSNPFMPKMPRGRSPH